MKVYKTEDNKKKEFPTDVIGSIFPEVFDILCVEMTLQAGGKIPTHSKDSDAMFYIISGEVVVVVGEEEQLVTAGTLIESPVDALHGVQNRSDSVAKVLVIKK